MSTVAPGRTSIAGAVSDRCFAGGAVSALVCGLLPVGAYVHVTPAWVSPNGIVKPPADTEVMLFVPSVSDFPAWSSSVPSGAFTTPPCTILSATRASEPPAEKTSPARPDPRLIAMLPSGMVAPLIPSATDTLNAEPVVG